jgi:hypothetical protein
LLRLAFFSLAGGAGSWFLGGTVPADPVSTGLGGVPFAASGFDSSDSFFSSCALAFFSSVTLRPMTPRYQNMRLEMRTCSYSGLLAFASLM